MIKVVVVTLWFVLYTLLSKRQTSSSLRLLFIPHLLSSSRETQLPPISTMVVTECYADEEPQQNPWVQTPLRESYALSEAAGWYGHTLPSLTLAVAPRKRDF
jgi:hypothetical protein